MADTPWALPWRATVEAATKYSVDRQCEGFNAARLMGVQPDQDARGPQRRREMGDFDELWDGDLNKLRPEYFRCLASLLDETYKHAVAPVLQPAFQGYGWKGHRTQGSDAVPEEYARYCRYLVGCYGARPAMWLIGGIEQGAYRSTIACGEEIEKWDACLQSAGFHCSPSDRRPRR